MKITITLTDPDKAAAFKALKDLEPWLLNPDRRPGEGYNLYVVENRAGRTRHVGKVEITAS